MMFNELIDFRRIVFSMLILLLSACTTVTYNGSEKLLRNMDYPEVGEEVTIYLGDEMLSKGFIYEEPVLFVKEYVSGTFYEIPSQSYPQIGNDDSQEFFSARGVIRGGFSDPAAALAVRSKRPNELCVITVSSTAACYDAKLEKRMQISESENGFKQTLIYNGRVGSKINIGYREFSNNIARPAFSNEVEYDLSDSKIIGYKGAVIEVLKADNMSITYKLIRNFP